MAVPYALDALDPRELRRFERHLTRCAPCRTEAREMGEGAVRLAGAAAAPAPPALRERVLAAVRTTEQEPPPRAPVTPSAPPRARALLVPSGVPVGAFTSLAALALVLALAASVILAVQLVRSDGRIDRERADAREIAHVLAAPDARASAERDAWGRGINVVASESRRRAVVTVTGLGAPPRGRVHQLWVMRPASAPRSLGLLDGETPVIAAGLSASGASLAVTIEPDGGSERPTSAPLVQLALESVGFGE
ncbi:anti-sigma factor [Streptomyces durmitorensis]|uniref:Regulator of SigK n=1 Tax=Streptomyces durmitorensis TaxID=319947 RepID=A0ABY4Q7W7_9ACTN|nr:anti-sigma factor [Streptomyces durmitorensis]UQT61805.1 anti-sigma factor [Streptomyces durmitorensis]